MSARSLKLTPAAVLAAVLIATLAAVLPARSADTAAETVLAQQQAYFEKLTSIEFYAETVLSWSPAAQERADLPASTHKSDLRFVSSGDKFRSEIRLSDISTGRPMALIYAYDGELYQHLSGIEEPLLAVSRTAKTKNVYGTLQPIVAAFMFALSPDDELSMRPLREPETWTRLADAIVGAEEDVTMLGHHGVKLHVRVPGPSGSGEVAYGIFFADDLDYLPLHYTSITTQAGTTVMSEFAVTAVESLDSPAGRLHIPTRQEWSSHAAEGALAQTGSMQIDAKTLKVNHQVDDATFTIPRSSATRYVEEPVTPQ